MGTISGKKYPVLLGGLTALLVLGACANIQDNAAQVVDDGTAQNDAVQMDDNDNAPGTLVPVVNGVYAFDPHDGYNSMFVVTDDGVIAIEPGTPQHATGLLAAIRSVTDQPVKYLLHSHNHWDHAKGGNVFREAGATIVAHEEAYAWMEANPSPDLALPDEQWSGEKTEISLGGRTIELHYFGMNHGLGMTYRR